jgi:glutamate--cysteine ligase
MPTEDRRQALTAECARERAGELAFPKEPSGDRLGAVGLEPEFFPIYLGVDERPVGRLPLLAVDGSGVLDVVDRLATAAPLIGSRQGGPVGPWEYPIVDGGRLTFEPGAQVEHSTAVYPSIRQALDGVRSVVGLLRTAFADRKAVLAAAGLDIWHEPDTVPQQLPFGRYTAQAAYYDSRGPWGGVMMRHTASLQLNLDLGPEGVWQQRWLLANLISPLISASFACSPSEDAVCTRALAWQQLDPSRSGFPQLLVDGPGTDPRDEWATAAFAADVMLFRLGGGRWEPGSAGFSFERWLQEGHPDWGWPTIDDFDYHLTTLFFDVRPRGFLELRAGEAVPDCWRAAQVVLATALLYDDRAREAALLLLEEQRPRLPELWRRAALQGVRDPELRELACAVWEEALRAAERLPDGYIGDKDAACARDFLDRFTFAGRMPADELQELDAEDPARSLAWAAATPEG